MILKQHLFVLWMVQKRGTKISYRGGNIMMIFTVKFAMEKKYYEFTHALVRGLPGASKMFVCLLIVLKIASLNVLRWKNRRMDLQLFRTSLTST